MLCLILVVGKDPISHMIISQRISENNGAMELRMLCLGRLKAVAERGLVASDCKKLSKERVSGLVCRQ